MNTAMTSVATTSTEGPYNYPTEAVTDPVTQQPQTDWDHVMLNTIKAAGVIPDYLICHRYEQNAGQESDASSVPDPVIRGHHATARESGMKGALA